MLMGRGDVEGKGGMLKGRGDVEGKGKGMGVLMGRGGC